MTQMSPIVLVFEQATHLGARLFPCRPLALFTGVFHTFIGAILRMRSYDRGCRACTLIAGFVQHAAAARGLSAAQADHAATMERIRQRTEAASTAKTVLAHELEDAKQLLQLLQRPAE